MPERPTELAEIAFSDLISSGEIQLIDDNGDLHIAGDDWTLVLEGDPFADALIALEDEDGEPESALRGVISEEAFASMRDLDTHLGGDLISALEKSPDPLARKLAELLKG